MQGLIRRCLILELTFFIAVLLLAAGPFHRLSPSLVGPLMKSLKSSVGQLHTGTIGFALLLFRHNALPLLPFALAVLLRRHERYRRLWRFLALVSILLYAYNAVIVGAVLGVIPTVEHIAVGLLFLRGILPHGIFEIGAFSLLLAANMGPPQTKPWRIVLDGYVLLGIAALVESFVTPLLLR